MLEIHSTEKIRIKDIAEKSGVSVGTVDRVLHNRPNVSAKARAKVESVLKEINYQPNMYASALASNKKYTFYCLLPDHDQNAYWTQVEQGLQKAVINRNDFHLSLRTVYYDQFDKDSFAQAAGQIMENNPDGVIMVPQNETVTGKFCKSLSDNNIPFVFLDSNIPHIPALTFFGQDSLKSGYFAGRIFMMQAEKEPQIMLMKLIYNGKVASRQQEYREIGFRQYMNKHFPSCEIVELRLLLNKEDNYDQQIEDYLASYPDIRHCITFCSRAYILGDFLRKRQLENYHVFGYDMIERNVECLKKGTIDFLIAQHPWKQGYNCVKSLFNHLVMKKKVERNNYMPVELLTMENYIFYTNDLLKQNEK